MRKLAFLVVTMIAGVVIMACSSSGSSGGDTVEGTVQSAGTSAASISSGVGAAAAIVGGFNFSPSIVTPTAKALVTPKTPAGVDACPSGDPMEIYTEIVVTNPGSSCYVTVVVPATECGTGCTASGGYYFVYSAGSLSPDMTTLSMSGTFSSDSGAQITVILADYAFEYSLGGETFIGTAATTEATSHITCSVGGTFSWSANDTTVTDTGILPTSNCTGEVMVAITSPEAANINVTLSGEELAVALSDFTFTGTSISAIDTITLTATDIAASVTSVGNYLCSGGASGSWTGGDPTITVTSLACAEVAAP